MIQRRIRPPNLARRALRSGRVVTSVRAEDYQAARRAWVKEFVSCANAELGDLRGRVPKLTGALRRSAFAKAAPSGQSALIGFSANFAPYVKFKRPIKGKRRVDKVLDSWERTLAGKSCRRKAREKAEEVRNRRHRRLHAAAINTRRVRRTVRGVGRALDAITRYSLAFGSGARIIVRATRFLFFRIGPGITP